MKLLFVADLHYALKQFDWLVAEAGNYELVVIGGDLLDMATEPETRKYKQPVVSPSLRITAPGSKRRDSRPWRVASKVVDMEPLSSRIRAMATAVGKLTRPYSLIYFGAGR